MAYYVVLLGPPGVGKGTQAKILAEKTGMVHVSSGDLFRDNIKAGTDLGKLAKTFIDKGELVPDDVTIAMVKDRLSRPDCETGAILDGFPRTPVQADALDVMLKELSGSVNFVPFISAPPEILTERIGGRWTCRAQGHSYHEKFNPPAIPGKCDIDGSDLFQRNDDKMETVSRRINVYFEQTMPLVEYYRSQKKLVEIDGTQPIEVVTDTLLLQIKK